MGISPPDFPAYSSFLPVMPSPNTRSTSDSFFTSSYNQSVMKYGKIFHPTFASQVHPCLCPQLPPQSGAFITSTVEHYEDPIHPFNNSISDLLGSGGVRSKHPVHALMKLQYPISQVQTHVPHSSSIIVPWRLSSRILKVFLPTLFHFAKHLVKLKFQRQHGTMDSQLGPPIHQAHTGQAMHLALEILK